MRLRGRRFYAGALFAFFAVSCAPQQPDARESETSAPDAPHYGLLNQVPPGFVGTWRLDRRECYDDLPEEDVPAGNLPDVALTIADDFTYVMSVEGNFYVDTWVPQGRFTVSRSVSDTQLKLEENSLEFVIEDGTLQNWSEGDAPYVCGFVYEREK